MRLPHERYALSNINLNFTQLRDCIIERRKVIREHRDAKGDDRCWIDDHSAWNMLLSHADFRSAIPPYHEMRKMCLDFYSNRNAVTADPIPATAIVERFHLDDDLLKMNETQLFDELLRIQQAIYNHLVIGDRSRTVDDDRKLYWVLPEKTPADFRLPPEEDFLWFAKAPKAGCPSFWRSHNKGNCRGVGHNLHQWGPCKDDE